MIRVVHHGSRIRMLTFYPSRIPDPGSRGQKGNRFRIPDPDPQHWNFVPDLHSEHGTMIRNITF
jgi:hypothetical protein